ncbi:hypothetical protein [Streptomyces qinzhouensis]|uniref:hypothetical protein n=1 Tax=Streptomyces qinzhouensis TaxID=2599401 RepID=UPI001649636D|nr:hypothetical protein [Streptomyces qinzhouensis]
MDSFQGTATLDWWANGSLRLGGYEVQVTVGVAGDEWACEAAFGPEPRSDEDREGFDFLMDLDPVFTLRFDEGSEILVNVRRTGDAGRLVLTAFEASESLSSEALTMAAEVGAALRAARPGGGSAAPRG